MTFTVKIISIREKKKKKNQICLTVPIQFSNSKNDYSTFTVLIIFIETLKRTKTEPTRNKAYNTFKLLMTKKKEFKKYISF